MRVLRLILWLKLSQHIVQEYGFSPGSVPNVLFSNTGFERKHESPLCDTQCVFAMSEHSRAGSGVDKGAKLFGQLHGMYGLTIRTAPYTVCVLHTQAARMAPYT